MPAVAEGVQAGGGAAEIDHGEEERGQRVEAEMRADPGQAERQHQALRRTGQAERTPHDEPAQRMQAAAVDQDAVPRTPCERAGQGERDSPDHRGDAVMAAAINALIMRSRFVIRASCRRVRHVVTRAAHRVRRRR